MKKRSLFIGRFQPFHLGHLSVIRHVLTESEELIIAIGSSEQSFEDINPFTCEERVEMIQTVLDAENIPSDRISIVAVPDINDDTAWVAHVQSLCPKFDSVYTGVNQGYKYIQKLFEDAGVPVNIFKNVLDIESSMIRERIKKDEDWKELVHSKVAAYLKQIDGIQRIKNITKQGKKKT